MRKKRISGQSVFVLLLLLGLVLGLAACGGSGASALRDTAWEFVLTIPIILALVLRLA